MSKTLLSTLLVVFLGGSAFAADAPDAKKTGTEAKSDDGAKDKAKTTKPKTKTPVKKDVDKAKKPATTDKSADKTKK